MKRYKYKSRKRIKGSIDNPRVIFNETNRYLITQAINDNLGHTISFLTSKNISYKDSKIKTFSKKNFFFVGKLAEMFAINLISKGIKKINFDRRNRRYIGKVKYFCDSLKKLISINESG